MSFAHSESESESEWHPHQPEGNGISHKENLTGSDTLCEGDGISHKENLTGSGTPCEGDIRDSSTSYIDSNTSYIDSNTSYRDSNTSYIDSNTSYRDSSTSYCSTSYEEGKINVPQVIPNIKSKLLKVSNLVGGKPNDLKLKVRLGDFCVYGDPVTNTTAIQASGQVIHYNNKKITLRRSQPIFISPKGILHKFDNDFIDPKTPVITLSYQKLKTGDIIQGIPKVEQFFEARTTKRGRFFRDSLPYLLKTLFKRYSTKLPLDLAVRQSFYKIQQILVDGVHRVYKAQGVTISDKHLEVIVKQMTSKVRIIDGAQTGFFAGEILDLFFVEKINTFLMKKITYEPLVLGITKASLEVDSFLSAASFQQTTRVLSKAALFRKKDFLKGLKENVILGNLIPAGTGFLVYIDL
jgi:DNA-directed RNA polymerase subunit beta'